MMHESSLRRIEALAEGQDVDEYTLNTEAIRIGADFKGLQMLVDRWGHSSNMLLVRAVTFPLARAPWEFEAAGPELYDLVVRFISKAGRSGDAGTLIGTASALQGLSIRGLLTAIEDDRALVTEFILHSLEHPDPSVKSSCLDLVGHLTADGTLERVIPPEARGKLKSGLASIAQEHGDEFRSELAAMGDFLDDI